MKTIIKNIAWCETKVWSKNDVTITIIGTNTRGKRVEVVLENQPTYMLSHIADEIAQALVKVRGKVQNDIDSVKQSLE